jgi:hypothetical protein
VPSISKMRAFMLASLMLRFTRSLPSPLHGHRIVLYRAIYYPKVTDKTMN